MDILIKTIVFDSVCREITLESEINMRSLLKNYFIRECYGEPVVVDTDGTSHNTKELIFVGNDLNVAFEKFNKHVQNKFYSHYGNK